MWDLAVIGPMGWLHAILCGDWVLCGWESRGDLAPSCLSSLLTLYSPPWALWPSDIDLLNVLCTLLFISQLQTFHCLSSMSAMLPSLISASCLHSRLEFPDIVTRTSVILISKEYWSSLWHQDLRAFRPSCWLLPKTFYIEIFRNKDVLSRGHLSQRYFLYLRPEGY